MRLIDADAMRLNCSIKLTDEDARKLKGSLQKMFDDTPTVDAVPVVRCKDCVQWFSSIGWCGIHSHMTLDGDWNMFSENDYCSYGKRGTDGTD